MAAGALLPCPMSWLEFLKASHFALGPEPRLHADAKQSASHRDFPAYRNVTRGPLCQPPPRASLFQQDARWAGQKLLSETHCAYAPASPLLSRERERELARERTLAMQASNLHAHADSRASTGLSPARAHCGRPALPERASEQIRGARLIFDRDSVPSRDRAKLPIPPSAHQEFFSLHDICPKLREPSCHFGERAPGHPRQFTQHNGSHGERGFCAQPSGHLAMPGDHILVFTTGRGGGGRRRYHQGAAGGQGCC